MWRFVPALCLCLALLAGCGADEKAPTRTVRAQAGEPLRVTAREYSFDPGAIVVGGGGELQITLDNRGSLAHNIKVLDDGREVGGTESFPAGQQRATTVQVTPGSYRLVCTVGDHEDQGMVGNLEVR